MRKGLVIAAIAALFAIFAKSTIDVYRYAKLDDAKPADVIVIDTETSWILDPLDLKSKCKNTPFDDARLDGRVVRTIVAGRTAYEYASA